MAVKVVWLLKPHFHIPKHPRGQGVCSCVTCGSHFRKKAIAFLHSAITLYIFFRNSVFPIDDLGESVPFSLFLCHPVCASVFTSWKRLDVENLAALYSASPSVFSSLVSSQILKLLQSWNFAFFCQSSHLHTLRFHYIRFLHLFQCDKTETRYTIRMFSS